MRTKHALPKSPLAGTWDVDLLIGAYNSILGRLYSRREGNYDFTFLYTLDGEPLAIWFWQHDGQTVDASEWLARLKENAPAYFTDTGTNEAAQEIIQNAIFTVEDRA